MTINFKDLHYSVHIASLFFLMAILIVVLSIYSLTKNINSKKCGSCNFKKLHISPITKTCPCDNQ